MVLTSLTLLLWIGRQGGYAQNTPPKTAEELKAPAGALTVPPNVLLPTIMGYRIWNGLMLVQGATDATHRENFVIDTALNACTVTPDMGKQLGLPALPGQTQVQVFDQAHSAALAQIPKLEFNTFALTKVPVALLDVFALLSPTIANRPDAPAGWLGTPFLSAFQVTFDYERRLILLERPDAPLPKEKDVIVTPMEFSNGQVLVKVALPGARPFPALLATSTPITIIPTKIAQAAKLKPQELMSFTQQGGKEGKLARVVLPRLSVGRAEVQNATAVYVAPESPAEFDRQLAVLGADFLRHYRVTISYTRRQLAFAPIAKPNAAPPKPEAKTAEQTEAKEP